MHMQATYRIQGYKKSSKVKNGIGIGFFAAAVFMAMRMLSAGLSDAIWYDELFTMGFAKRSFGEIIALTARDVHPPLYYFLVRLAVSAVQAIRPGANAVVAAKMLSVLPCLVLFFYLAFLLRKERGWFTAGLSAFLILCMPRMLSYSVEIRMYSFALWFITAMYLHLLGIYKYGRKRDWILFVLYGICAAYTHYFAAAAAAALYLCLLVFLARQRKRQLKFWLAGSVFTAIAYLPWAFVVISQVNKVKENYWILPLTWKSIFGCVKYLFLPTSIVGKAAYLVAVLLIAAYGISFLWCLKKGDQLTVLSAASGLAVLALTVGFGFAASFLLRPVFVYRYMLPAAGCFWICFALCLNRLWEDKRLRLLAGLAVLLAAFAGVSDGRAAIGNEKWTTLQMQAVKEAVLREKVAPEDILIFNFDQLQAVARYYLENESYLWCGEAEPLIQEMFGPFGSLETSGQIGQLLDTGRGVWFLGSGNAREEIRQLWEEAELSVTEEGSYLIETYWFNLYRVSR